MHIDGLQFRAVMENLTYIFVCNRAIEAVDASRNHGVYRLQSVWQGDLFDLCAGKRSLINSQSGIATHLKNNASHVHIVGERILVHQCYASGNRNVDQISLIESILANDLKASTEGNRIQSAPSGFYRKGILSNGLELRVFAHINGCQGRLVVEDAVTDRNQTVRQHQVRNIGAKEHAKIPVFRFRNIIPQAADGQGFFTLRKGDCGQGHIVEHILADSFHIGRDMNAGELGILKQFVVQNCNRLRNHEGSQRRALESAGTDVARVGRQRNTGKLVAACKRVSTNGQAGAASLEGDSAQIVAVLKCVSANAGNRSGNLNCGNLGVALENIGADLLQVGVQFAQVAVQCSGVEQQFFITGRVQCAAVGDEVGVPLFYHDFGEGFTAGKHGAIEGAQRSRQIDGSQAEATGKHVGAKGHILIGGNEDHTVKLFTTGECTVTHGCQCCRDHSLRQLNATGIRFFSEALDLGILCIGKVGQLFIGSEGALSDDDVGAVLKNHGAQLTKALEGAGADGCDTRILLAGIVALECNCLNIVTSGKRLVVNQQIVFAGTFEDDLGNTGAV